ncbi:HD-GYP domain-containing protein [Thermus thermophilus]|uniref:HD-GYP domain-containing protein n=1 Tax=Thermus thermophilus TaxID=274 RepID=UPI001FAED27A
MRYYASCENQASFETFLQGVVSKASSLPGVEGVYVLRKEEERYRVVAAGGSAAGTRGLYLPRDWELREGPTDPPGPLGFSPDGTPRAGFVALGENHALALEGTSALSHERQELMKLWVDLLDREFQMRQGLETLLGVGRQLRNGRLPEEAVAQVLEALLRFGGWDLAVALREHEGTFVPWVRVGALDFVLSHEEVRSLQELLRKAVGRAEAPGIPWVVQDVQAVFPYLPALKRLGVQTVAVFFLGEGTPAGVFGALILASLKRFPHFSPETLLLLQIAKEELESWLRKTWYAEGLLRAFARVMEVLDCETHGHMERVSRLAVALGRVAGVKDLHGLYVGAYLHDLGKLFLPQELLKKDGPLLTQEWTQIKTHPEAGYEVLSPIPFLSPTALNVVLHHHEHWDGTGYPRGLRGEAIPLEARVFAVVDVWDALISQRPYKPALPPEIAAKELQAAAGRKLDPRLVECFLRLWREELEAGRV